MNDTIHSPRPQISLLGMAHFLGRHIVLIGTCVVLGAALLGALSFVLRPMYRSEVEFAPTNGSGGGLGDLGGGSLGGLAALAVVSIGGGVKRS
jgi:hypothetical protein